jgi:hypothetical protein
MMPAFVSVLVLFVSAQDAPAQPAVQDPPAAAEPAPADPAAPAAEPATTTAPVTEVAPVAAVEPVAPVPRANDAPITETTPEMKVGKIVSGVVLASGVMLTVVGLFGLTGAALVASPLLESQFESNTNPRRTVGTLFSAVAAGGLMLGLTCVLGGLFGVFVG